MRPDITWDSYDAYANVIHKHICPIIGNISMTKLNMGHIQKLYQQKAEEAQSQVRQVKTIMNTSMKFALAKKVIASNPAAGVDLPKCIKRNPYRVRNIDSQKTLTAEQIIQLIEASKETPIYLQVLLNVLMGLRRSEINGVKYSDINYVERTLTVQRQLGRIPNTKPEDFAAKTFTKQEIKVKTPSSNRVLPIPDYVFEAILEERKQYEKNRRRRTREFQDMDYICCSTYGRPRSKDFHYHYYKKLLKENGLPEEDTEKYKNHTDVIIDISEYLLFEAV